MSSRLNLVPIPEDLPGLIKALEVWVERTKRNASDYEGRHFNGIREKALVHCLHHSADIAEGCMAAARSRLPELSGHP